MFWVCCFCLHQFCGDVGADEVECFLLEFGGFGEHVKGGDVGLVGDTDLVAGEGGEMVQERFEAVGGVPCGGEAGRGFVLSIGGSLGFGDGVEAVVGWSFVGEAQR